MPAPTEAQAAPPPSTIAQHYTTILTRDPSITMPIAAIKALLVSLENHPTTTAAETLQFLQTQVDDLLASQPNYLSISAGTDLFQRYIVSLMERQGGTSDFGVVRERLLASGRQFAEVAKESRNRVAIFGSKLIRDDMTILTLGGSRVVGALLQHAAEASIGDVRFRVLYVLHDGETNNQKGKEQPEGSSIASALRAKGIPTATVPISAVSHLMGERRVDMCIVGAEAVVENGGVISRMGTSLVAWAAKQRKIPVYVAVESQKFVRRFPNDTYEVPLRQEVVKFSCVEGGEMVEVEDNVGIASQEGLAVMRADQFVDYTHPKYITGIVTENGVIMPSVVSHELMKMWY